MSYMQLIQPYGNSSISFKEWSEIFINISTLTLRIFFKQYKYSYNWDFFLKKSLLGKNSKGQSNLDYPYLKGP